MFAGLKSIRRERAELERVRVLFTEMVNGSKVQDIFDSAFQRDFFEGVSSEELEELIARIPESDEEDNQVDRILSSDEDLTMSKIFGIEDDDYGDIEID